MRIGEALIDLKLASDTAVYKALAAQHNMEFFDLEKNSIPANAVNLIADDLMRKYLILPLGTENGRLRLAVHDPLDLEMFDILRFRLHKEIRTVARAKHADQGDPGRTFQYLGGEHHRQDHGPYDRPAAQLKSTGPIDRSMDKSVDKVDRQIDRHGGIGRGRRDDPRRPRSLSWFRP